MSSTEERKKVRRALISVSDREGLGDLGRALTAAGAKVVATSSTAAALREDGVEVMEVSDLTGFPEVLGGRVKTLHPAVHAGILARQDDEESLASLEELRIEPFDMVVVNFYPFSRTLVSAPSEAEAVEMIDIGGPTLVRAAAKNSDSVAVVTDPSQYDTVIAALHEGGTTSDLRRRLATQAFQMVADYDIAIANWMVTRDEGGMGAPGGVRGTVFPAWVGLSFRKHGDLRYGENPHQGAALYTSVDTSEQSGGLAYATQLGGKPLSYNNLQDADAAWRAANDFSDQPAVAIVKHVNPCGLAVGETIAHAYAKALACDPLSAFGGVVAANREINAESARYITHIFTEVVVAPGYTDEALDILRAKPSLRILKIPPLSLDRHLRPINGGLLLQDADRPVAEDKLEEWELVAGPPATPSQTRDLEFAWRAAQYVKSNAIVLVRDEATVGVGMGQVNRVDAAKLAVERANSLAGEERRSEGASCASDAFFPFPDGLEVLSTSGVTAVVAPGGSRNDHLVIAAAQNAGITLYFTGVRHFAH